MNPSIAKLLIGKNEQDAALILQRFGKSWRVIFRDGNPVPNLTPDRNDNRYGLVLKEAIITRVIFG